MELFVKVIHFWPSTFRELSKVLTDLLDKFVSLRVFISRFWSLGTTKYCKMLNQTVKEYSAYLKLNVSSELKSVQDVIDNMLTRLEELSSVLQMIKVKNSECFSTVSEDINKYRSEVTILSKKINTLNEVMMKVHTNVDTLEKHVEKAELDFGVNSDNRIKSFLKPFLKRTTASEGPVTWSPGSFELQSVMDNFTDGV